MLSAPAFYPGKVKEWLAHVLACRDIIDKIGGPNHVDQVLKSVIFITEAVVCGRSTIVE
jgi:hypothetical protein